MRRNTTINLLIITVALVFIIKATPSTAATLLKLSLNFKDEKSGSIFFSETDLPEGTQISIEIYGKHYQGFDDIFVKNVRFESPLFTDEGKPLPERLSVELYVYLNEPGLCG